MTSALYVPAQMIDAHQHLWKISERRYDWITPDAGILNADYGPEDVEADARAAGVTGTVLVQAAETYDDTFYLLSVAASTPTVRGVVGWVPLDRTAEALAALELYAQAPALKGIRVLSHDKADPNWMLRDDVTATIAAMSRLGLTLDYVTGGPERLAILPELARRHPELTIVLDHLGKPDIAGHGFEEWAEAIAPCAAEPNVVVKLSGLNTVSAPGWTVADWQPYVDRAVALFGSERLMLGSDWPMSLLNGDFGGVWRGLRESIAGLPTDQQDDIYYRTATRVYSLEG
ncbi:amidohydrolase family protein [Microterricola viridarii]|uniref:L-fuconolactonase n=1 Tax=Microterricola viridarii TaxID=412690 RepID=A0A1H1MF62_9MICO|nr:amidohydrolase family protein [Microterricola viridarii]SDR84609.1 L-fuconolactonase [Microterricola viridarii]